IASQFNDPGISWMFANLCRLLREKGRKGGQSDFSPHHPTAGQANEGKSHSDPLFSSPHFHFTPHIDTSLKEPRATVLIPGARVRYLAEIAEQGRAINASIERQAEAADRAQSFWQSLQELEDPKLPKALDLYHADDLLPQPPLPPQGGGSPREAGDGGQAFRTDRSLLTLRQRYNDAIQALTAENLRNLRDWPQRLKSITDEATEYQVRNKAIRVENYRQSL